MKLVPKIMVVAGTRPEIIKFAPVLGALDSRGIDCRFILSDQHCDHELTTIFMREAPFKQNKANCK